MANNVLILTLLLSHCCCSTISAAMILSDGFEDGVIDAANWSTRLPYHDSDVLESGGLLHLVNRGQLISSSSLPASIEVRGKFRFSGSPADAFNVFLRTDASNGIGNSGSFDNGLLASMHAPKTGPHFDAILALTDEASGTSTVLGTASISLAMNTFHDFLIRDDGTNIQFFVNDFTAPLLTGSSSIRFGDRIAFQNREGRGGGSSASDGSIVEIEYIEVQSLETPEPSSLVISAASLLGLVIVNGRRSKCILGKRIAPCFPSCVLAAFPLR